MSAFLLVSPTAPLNFLRMASSAVKPEEVPDQPQDFRYYQLYASEDGKTHFKLCHMKGFESKSYAPRTIPQFTKTDFGGEPTKLVFTELPVGQVQELHPCPEVQFVATLSGSWYIKTSDGTYHEFHAGDVLFQDDTESSPAANIPEHFSGVVGDKPCQQMIVQMSRKPEVNNPNPF